MTIKRCYPVLVGASVAENQLCNGESVTVPDGRKYYLKKSGTESLGASTGTAITELTSGSDMVIDLTKMLGSAIADYAYTLEQATAGSGIAWLRSYGFLGGYKAHNAGSIESVEVTEKKVVGFNQWDEEWEVGGYNSSTGEAVALTDRIRGKNYIPVIPSATYYFAMPSSTSGNVFFYDANKVFLSSQFLYAGTFSVPSNAYYLHIAMQPTYGTTYNNDICISLSSSRNGEYEPYTSQSYDYGSDTLRGIFKLDASNNLYADGDVKTSDGVITRKYALIDLGTLTWVKVTDDYAACTYMASGTVPLKKSGGAGLFCGKYFIGERLDRFRISNGQIANFNSSDSPAIVVRDDAYTDAATFKTAMNGVMLVYELATPTTEQGDPFPSPQVCYPDGTESFVTETGVPVGHETKYQL